MLGDGDAGLRFSGGLSAWENYFQNVQLPSLFEGFVLQLHIFYQKERINAFVFAFKYVFHPPMNIASPTYLVNEY